MDKPRSLKLAAVLVGFLGSLTLAFAGLIPFLRLLDLGFGSQLSWGEFGPDFFGNQIAILAMGVGYIVLAWGLWRAEVWAWVASLICLVGVLVAGNLIDHHQLGNLLAWPFNTQAFVVGSEILRNGVRTVGLDRERAIGVLNFLYALALLLLVAPWTLVAIWKQVGLPPANSNQELAPAPIRVIAPRTGSCPPDSSPPDWRGSGRSSS